MNSPRTTVVAYMHHVVGGERSDAELYFDAMLDGLKEAGWQMVPRSATKEMLDAGGAWVHEYEPGFDLPDESAFKVYKAMLSAAPDPLKENG